MRPALLPSVVFIVFMLAACTPSVPPNVYANEADCYVVHHADAYRPWGGDSLVNYDAADPKFERGNPDGVMIQIQRHQLQGSQTFDGAMEALAVDIADDEVALETPPEAVRMGAVRYRNRVIEGPSGKSELFYVPGISPTDVYLLMVWGMENDTAGVEAIARSFEPTACKATEQPVE